MFIHCLFQIRKVFVISGNEWYSICLVLGNRFLLKEMITVFVICSGKLVCKIVLLVTPFYESVV